MMAVIAGRARQVGAGLVLMLGQEMGDMPPYIFEDPRPSSKDRRSDVATCCTAIFSRRTPQVQCQLAGLHLAAAAWSSTKPPLNSSPVATLALRLRKLRASIGVLMPNQYTIRGIATVFHTPQRIPQSARKKYMHLIKYSSKKNSLRVLKRRALNMPKYVIIAP